METHHSVDKERNVKKGLAWEKFKLILKNQYPDLNLDNILDRRPLKRDPSVSHGLIEFSVKKNTKGRMCAYYHVYKRRSTIEYGRIIQGYSNKNQLFSQLCLLSLDERERILNNTWEDLWDDYWVDHKNSQYKSLKDQSKRKFDEIKTILREISDLTPCKIAERPYIFPKGKSEHGETGFETALREAREETKSSFDKGHLYFNSPITQHYLGSDGQRYTENYYVWFQKDVYYCPKMELLTEDEKLSGYPIYLMPYLHSDPTNDREELDVMMKEIILMVGKDNYTNVEGSTSVQNQQRQNEEKMTKVRLRKTTISHELEEDLWIEIPLYSTVKDTLEWSASIDPFKDYGIFKRHFLALMEIHRRLGPELFSTL